MANKKDAKRNHTKSDVILKDFWRQNERFADLFNAVVFQGESILAPENLREMDTDISGTIRFKDYEQSLNRSRDVVKKMAFGVEFVVFGIENQQNIHYGMPLRMLLYDGMGYLKEYQELSRSRRSEASSDRTKDEFLSGMRKGDRLHPVISLVIYYSEKVWDGPLCLRDMVTDMPKALEHIFSDYKMNLIQVRESDRYIFHNEDVRTVFEISRDIFNGNFARINTLYRDKTLSPELITVIGKITDSAELVQQGSRQEVNMCTALEKLKEEGRQAGIREGRQAGIREGRQAGIRDLVLDWLRDGYSVDEIARLLKKPADEVRQMQEEGRILRRQQ